MNVRDAIVLGSNAVVQYQIAVTEAAHNVVLLHLLRCMEPMLAQNVRQNFELLYARRDMLPLVSNHRTRVFEALNPFVAVCGVMNVRDAIVLGCGPARFPQ